MPDQGPRPLPQPMLKSQVYWLFRVITFKVFYCCIGEVKSSEELTFEHNFYLLVIANKK